MNVYVLEDLDREISRSYKLLDIDFVYIYKVYPYVKQSCDNALTTRDPLHTALFNYI